MTLDEAKASGKPFKRKPWPCGLWLVWRDGEFWFFPVTTFSAEGFVPKPKDFTRKDWIVRKD